MSKLLARMLRELVEKETGYARARERRLARLREGMDLGTGGQIGWSRNIAAMSGNRRFVDTDVLLYAHDDSAGDKREQARPWSSSCGISRGCLTFQVLQEFFVNPPGRSPSRSTRRRRRKSLPTSRAGTCTSRAAICWPRSASISRTGISFWDAMIVRSAAEIGCALFHSEDLNTGQEYSGVRAETRSSHQMPTAHNMLRPGAEALGPVWRRDHVAGKGWVGIASGW